MEFFPSEAPVGHATIVTVTVSLICPSAEAKDSVTINTPAKGGSAVPGTERRNPLLTDVFIE